MIEDELVYVEGSAVVVQDEVGGLAGRESQDSLRGTGWSLLLSSDMTSTVPRVMRRGTAEKTMGSSDAEKKMR